MARREDNNVVKRALMLEVNEQQSEEDQGRRGGNKLKRMQRELGWRRLQVGYDGERE